MLRPRLLRLLEQHSLPGRSLQWAEIDPQSLALHPRLEAVPSSLAGAAAALQELPTPLRILSRLLLTSEQQTRHVLARHGRSGSISE